ncbi:MAG: RdgB/HAM1 family non-canonical purine NTP pyrophosphatase [Myxococcaceae bacterium]|jgi:XTP/dITP diphosphohydrolase|nr:RdgB/HAM1 family non-canonical purine NTP pyrophosphatase [Myxococcaceae bacterium]
MNELVFATTNRGKLVELEGLVGARLSVRSLKDFPSLGEIAETADTFEGNAALKAVAVAAATGRWALADDSGLEVDALGGRPGVWSARYAPTDAERIAKLLSELEGVPAEARSARFVCALCLASPAGATVFRRGTCEGRIGVTPRGEHGFGYDPIFVLPSGHTLAELTHEQKSGLSHRGQAFRAMQPALERLLPR